MACYSVVLLPFVLFSRQLSGSLRPSVTFLVFACLPYVWTFCLSVWFCFSASPPLDLFASGPLSSCKLSVGFSLFNKSLKLFKFCLFILI